MVIVLILKIDCSFIVVFQIKLLIIVYCYYIYGYLDVCFFHSYIHNNLFFLGYGINFCVFCFVSSAFPKLFMGRRHLWECAACAALTFSNAQKGNIKQLKKTSFVKFSVFCQIFIVIYVWYL